MEDKLTDYTVKKFRNTSLYTWMRHNVTGNLPDTSSISSFSYTYYREDGLNISHDIVNSNFGIKEAFDKKVLSRVEEAITAIKDSRQHERSLLYTKVKYLDKNDTEYVSYITEEHLYLIVRFDDVKYVHEKYGPKVKQSISVTEIDTKYARDYLNHFKISGAVSDIVKNDYLLSLITVDSIDPNKFLNISKTGQLDVIESLEKTLNKLGKLNVYFLALLEEEITNLAKLPFVGQPNYSITTDNRVKVYLKPSSSESLGNGNANWFFLDTVEPSI